MSSFKSTEIKMDKKNNDNGPNYKQFYRCLLENILTDFSSIKESSLFESIDNGRNMFNDRFGREATKSIFSTFDEPYELFKFWACLASINKIMDGNNKIFGNYSYDENKKRQVIEKNNNYIILYELVLKEIIEDIYSQIISKNKVGDPNFKLTFDDSKDIVEVLTRYYHVSYNWNKGEDFISDDNHISIRSDSKKFRVDYDYICKDFGRIFSSKSCNIGCKFGVNCWNNIHLDFKYQENAVPNTYSMSENIPLFKKIIKNVICGSSNRFDFKKFEGSPVQSSVWSSTKKWSNNDDSKCKIVKIGPYKELDESEILRLQGLVSTNISRNDLEIILRRNSESFSTIDRVSLEETFDRFYTRISSIEDELDSTRIIFLWRKIVGETEFSYKDALNFANVNVTDFVKEYEEEHLSKEFLRGLSEMYLDKMAVILNLKLKDDPVFLKIGFRDDDLPSCLSDFEHINKDNLDKSKIMNDIRNINFMKSLFDLDEVRNYYLRDLKSLSFNEEFRDGFTSEYYFSTWIKSMEPYKFYCIMFYSKNYRLLSEYPMRFIINWMAKFKSISGLIGVNMNEKFKVANQVDIQKVIPSGEEYQKQIIKMTTILNSIDFQDFIRKVVEWKGFFEWFYKIKDPHEGKKIFVAYELYINNFTRRFREDIEKKKHSEVNEIFDAFKISVDVKKLIENNIGKIKDDSEIRELAFKQAKHEYDQGWRCSHGNSNKCRSIDIRKLGKEESNRYKKDEIDSISSKLIDYCGSPVSQSNKLKF